MNNVEKFCLIGKIKGLANQAQVTRILISKAKKQERVWSLCATKRGIGIDARHHLLAYGLLKGTPYRAMESKCRDDNKPSATYLRSVLALHMSTYTLDRLWSLEKISAWLSEPSVSNVVQPRRPRRTAEEIAVIRAQFSKRAC